MPILLRSIRFGGGTPAQTRRPPSQSSDHLRSVNQPGTAAGGSRRPSQNYILSRRPVSVELSARRSQENILTSQQSTDDSLGLGIVVPMPPKPTLGERIGSFYKQLHMNHLIPLLLILVYNFIGAVIFMWLEGGIGGGSDNSSTHPHSDDRSELMKRLEEIFEDRAARRRVARRQFLRDALDHYDTRTGVLSERSGQEWTLTSSMYFAGTLFTTIGYGDMACVTAAGRIATVVYSCVGIPIMLITLNDLGKFLYAHINSIVKALKGALAKIKLLRKLLPFLRREVKDDEVTMQDIEAQIEVDSAKSELGSLPSVEELEEKKMPRMGVITALSITIGWIFFCAALFGLWEDWSYGESCYFMFISLSTIGLGDVSVQRKDLMVLCFVFVIIGLSLVSMSISVVQQAIEDLYVGIIMKLLKEYQENLAAGGDQLGASVGMMRMWGSNRAAKFLMPLLSKEKKRYAMEKVEHEAKQAGLDIPPILQDLDEKTGLPKILNIKEETPAPTENGQIIPVFPAELERLLMKQEIMQEEAAMTVPLPTIVTHTSATQTDVALCSEKSEQTEQQKMDDSGIQTEERLAEYEEQITQTETVQSEEGGFQTDKAHLSDATTSTAIISSIETDSQTDEVRTMDEEVQSYLVEHLDAETEMEKIETKNIRLQTPTAVIVEMAVQTENLHEKSPSKMAQAKRRLRRAFGRRSDYKRRNSFGDLDFKEEEEDDSDGSEESLHWDPVDGLHAEKQQPVKKLTAMFESPELGDKRKHEATPHNRFKK